MRNKAVVLGALVFGVVAYCHLVRVFYPFDFIVGEFSVPIWMSAVGFVVAGTLSAWLFRALGDLL